MASTTNQSKYNLLAPKPILLEGGGQLPGLTAIQPEVGAVDDAKEIIGDVSTASKVTGIRIPGLSVLKNITKGIDIADALFRGDVDSAVQAGVGQIIAKAVSPVVKTIAASGPANVVISQVIGEVVNDVAGPISRDVHTFTHNLQSKNSIPAADGGVYTKGEQGTWTHSKSIPNSPGPGPAPFVQRSVGVNEIATEQLEDKLFLINNTDYERILFNGQPADSLTYKEPNINGDITQIIVIEGGNTFTLQGDDRIGFKNADGLFRVVTESFGDYYATDYASKSLTTPLGPPALLSAEQVKNTLRGESGAEFRTHGEQIENHDLLIDQNTLIKTRLAAGGNVDSLQVAAQIGQANINIENLRSFRADLLKELNGKEFHNTARIDEWYEETAVRNNEIEQRIQEIDAQNAELTHYNDVKLDGIKDRNNIEKQQLLEEQKSMVDYPKSLLGTDNSRDTQSNQAGILDDDPWGRSISFDNDSSNTLQDHALPNNDDFEDARGDRRAASLTDLSHASPIDIDGTADYDESQPGSGFGETQQEARAPLLNDDITRQAYETAASSAISAVNAIQSGHEWTALDGVIDSALSLDRGYEHALSLNTDSLNTDSPEGYFGDSTENALSAGSEFPDIVSAYESGNKAVAVFETVDLVNRSMQASSTDIDLGETQRVGGTNGAAALSMLNAFNSFDNGNDVVGAIQLANSISLFTNSTPIPGMAYVGAIAMALDGDLEGAAISAATTYIATAVSSAITSAASLGAAAGPVGVVVAVVVAIVLSSFMKQPPPEAWSDFNIAEDGTIDYMIGSNKTGGDLEESVDYYSQGLVDVLSQTRSLLESKNMDFKESYIHRFGMEGESYYFNNTITDSDGSVNMRHWVEGEDISSMMATLAIGGSMIANGMTTFISSPYAGDTDWSHSIRSTGVYAGGGQAYTAPVVVQASQISTIPTPRLTPARELKEISQTWGVKGNLFHGEQGSLLAMGLGSGTISYAVVAELTRPGQKPIISLLDNPEVLDLLPAQSTSAVVAGYGLIGELEIEDNITTPTVDYTHSYSSVYVPPHTDPNPDESVRDVDNGSGNSELGGDEHTSGPVLLEDVLLFNHDLLTDLSDDDEQSGFVLSDPQGAGIRIPADNNTEIAGTTVPTSTDPELNQSAASLPVFDFSMLEDRALYTTPAELLKDAEAGTTFVGLGTARNGTVILDAQGEIAFTPDSDFAGLAQFSYLQMSPAGVTRSVTVNINVQPDNDAPDALEDGPIALVEDTPFNLNHLLANDTDRDGDGIHVVGVSQVNTGQILVNGSGEFQFIPEADFTGTVELVYVIADPDGQTSIARAQLHYTAGPNEAPTVVNDVLADAIEETAYQFNASDLLLNDSDGDGDKLSLTDIRLNDNRQGVVSFDPVSGLISVTPGPNVHGKINLTYTVSDGILTTEGQVDIQFANTPDLFSVDNSAFTIDEDAITLFPASSLMNNVVNEDSHTTTISAVRMVSGEVGIVDLLADGSVRFIPGPEFSGDTAFEVRLTNGLTGDQMQRITSRVDITVTPQNDAPLAGDDDFNDANEDSDYRFNVAALIANDRDQEGDAFSLTDLALTDPALGALAWDQLSGEVIFSPALNFFGVVPLNYTLTETASGLTSTGSARIVVANVDDGFTNSDKAFSLSEDEVVVYGKEVLLDTLTDVDGEALDIVNVRMTDPAQGDVLLLADGSVRFTPVAHLNSGVSGLVRFEIDVSDGHSTRTSRINLTVDAVNDGPMITDESFNNGNEENVYTLNTADILGNDRDPDGTDHPLTITDIHLSDPAQGTISLDPVTGQIDLTPAADVFGDIAFVYTVTDDQGLSDTGRTTITFAGGNDTAAQSDKTFTLIEDEVRIFSRSVLLDNPVDVDGESILITNPVLSDPAAGMLTLLTNGDVRFVPAAQYTGQVELRFDASDQNTVGDPPVVVSVGLTIETQNDVPTAQADVFANALEDTAYQLNVSNLLANDFDEEGDVFRFTGIEVVDPRTGSIDWDQVTGNITFSPAADYQGAAQLRYTLTENDSGETGTGTASIIFANVDDTAEITDKSYRSFRPNDGFNLYEDEVKVFTRDVLLDTLVDVDGETLNIVNVKMTDPALGTVQITTQGHVQFVPKQDYTGEAVFTIDVTDGVTTTQSTMTVHLWPVNDAPVVSDDSESMLEDRTLTVSGADLLRNDVDVEGDSMGITGIWATSAGMAHYDVAADKIIYHPGENTFGQAWVDYIVEDGRGSWSVARLNVSITGSDDPVVAMDDQFNLMEDEMRVFSVSDLTNNDHNPDREVLTIVGLDGSGVTDGLVTLSAGGIAFTPNPDFAGTQQFDYTIQDQSGNQSTATATITIKQVNDAPQVTLQTASILEDTGMTFDVPDLLDNATDAEDDWMRIVGVRSQFGGVNFDEYTGKIAYTPIENFNSFLFGGPAVVEYLVQDERGAQTWAPIHIDVAPVNDPPQAFDDIVFAWSNGPGNYGNPIQSQWLLANDREVDGEGITVTAVTDSLNGDTALNDGIVTYTSDAGFIGTDRFDYTVFDGVIEGGAPSEDIATVTVNVLENHAPVSQDFATIAPEDTILRYTLDDLSPYVYDVDFGQAELPEVHHIESVGNADNGSVALNQDGSISFTPTQDYNSVQHAGSHGALASFEYTVEDIVGNQSTSTAYITYTPVNDNPVAVTDGIRNGVIKEETRGTIRIEDIIANDYDVDGDGVQFAGVLGASHGSVSVSGGNIVYQGGLNYVGSETIRYAVTDGNGGTGVGQIRFNVENVNDAPVVSYDTADGEDNRTNFYSASELLRDDFDVDGDNLYISNVRGAGASLSNSGISFSGPAGQHTIYYTVHDGTVGVESQLHLTVFHVDLPPVWHPFIYDRGGQKLHFNAYDNEDQTTRLNYFVAGADKPSGVSLYFDGIGYNGYSHDVQITGTHSGLSTGEFGEVNITVTIGAGDSGLNVSTASETITITVRGTGPRFGEGRPIVFDLNNDGLNLLGYAQSSAKYDWQSDGNLNRTGWIAGQGDGLLAYDHDGDGVIQLENEISFVEYLEGAQTDLEGLRAFDSDGDGLFSANDHDWDDFKLWVDDGDGLSEDGELMGLNEIGIASLSLTSDGEQYEQNGNQVFGEAVFTRNDGTVGMLGDVGFEIEEDLNETVETVTAPGEQITNIDLTEQQPALSEADLPASLVAQAITEESDLTDDAASVPEADEPAVEVVQPNDLDWLTDADIDAAVALGIQMIAAMPPEVEVVPQSNNPDSIVPPSVIVGDDDSQVG